ncbi:MAG TPA: DNA-3-methyladenine glycosylase [Terriglobia bacterium]|nr:DNA-3-methyladenine glycosylase [Terriglobia bacterium]
MRPSKGPMPRSFFSRDTCSVAQALLGCKLVRVLDGARLSGIIVETEAYIGEEDLACHARAGRTPRTEVMYGIAGYSYVYFTYGMHWLLNVITEGEGFPAAVLIRALEPKEGLDVMRERRGFQAGNLLCSGPARLTQALGIAAEENALDLCSKSSGLWIEGGPAIPDDLVFRGPRVGLGRTPEPWHSIPWRYLIQGSPFVSKIPSQAKKIDASHHLTRG